MLEQLAEHSALTEVTGIDLGMRGGYDGVDDEEEEEVDLEGTLTQKTNENKIIKKKTVESNSKASKRKLSVTKYSNKSKYLKDAFVCYSELAENIRKKNDANINDGSSLKAVLERANALEKKLNEFGINIESRNRNMKGKGTNKRRTLSYGGVGGGGGGDDDDDHSQKNDNDKNVVKSETIQKGNRNSILKKIKKNKKATRKKSIAKRNKKRAKGNGKRSKISKLSTANNKSSKKK